MRQEVHQLATGFKSAVEAIGSCEHPCPALKQSSSLMSYMDSGAVHGGDLFMRFYKLNERIKNCKCNKTTDLCPAGRIIGSSMYLATRLGGRGRLS